MPVDPHGPWLAGVWGEPSPQVPPWGRRGRKDFSTYPAYIWHDACINHNHSNTGLGELKT